VSGSGSVFRAMSITSDASGTSGAFTTSSGSPAASRSRRVGCRRQPTWWTRVMAGSWRRPAPTDVVVVRAVVDAQRLVVDQVPTRADGRLQEPRDRATARAGRTGSSPRPGAAATIPAPGRNTRRAARAPVRRSRSGCSVVVAGSGPDVVRVVRQGAAATVCHGGRVSLRVGRAATAPRTAAGPGTSDPVQVADGPVSPDRLPAPGRQRPGGRAPGQPGRVPA